MSGSNTLLRGAEPRSGKALAHQAKPERASRYADPRHRIEAYHRFTEYHMAPRAAASYLGTLGKLLS